MGGFRRALPPLNSYPTYVMGAGSIVMVVRERIGDRPDDDYGVYIRHTRAITSHVSHLHVPNANLDGTIAAVPESAWIHVGSLEDYIDLLGSQQILPSRESRR